MRLPAIGGLALISLMLTGCAGSHYRVSADRLRYPASLSPVLPDEQGRPRYLGEDLHPLGEFRFERAPVGFLYGLIGTTVDISDDLNREVERHRGEGVVRLSLRTGTCVSSWFFPLTVLPFYPGCQTLTVSGTVVATDPPGKSPERAAP